jgi:nitrite reductase (cytochrome c-552)
MKKNTLPSNCGLGFLFVLALLAGLTACAPAKPEANDSNAQQLAAVLGEDANAAASAAVMGLDSASWKDAYPAQFASFEAGREGRASKTGYGGSLQTDKLKEMPELLVLYAGSPFSKDYKEDRNHVWAWTDLKASGRVSAKTPASCLVCKTPEIADIMAKQGWDFAKQPLQTFLAGEHPTISCATCHDPETKRLRVIEPAFIDAMKTVNVDLAKASEHDLKNYVCAQCHVEYYFEPNSNKVSLPLVAGVTPKAMYDYYQTQPAGFAADFTNTVSGAPMLKAQHPDWEEYADSIHASAGLTCADCHMAKVKVGDTTIANHLVASPLNDIQDSCLACHKGKTEQWILDRVKYNQDRVYELMRQAGKSLATSHQAIGSAAADAKADAALIARARSTIREAQWYWDLVASANSMGFHNTTKTLSTLGSALDLSREARELAGKAVGRVL